MSLPNGLNRLIAQARRAFLYTVVRAIGRSLILLVVSRGLCQMHTDKLVLARSSLPDPSRWAATGQQPAPTHCPAPAQTVTIQSQNIHPLLSTQPLFSALPPQVDLNFEAAIPSSRARSHTAATIPPLDFSVFTTDSLQQSWLPSSSSSPPAPSAQPPNFQSPPQQDFVLFDSPQPQRTTVNRPSSVPSNSAAPFGSLQSNTTSTNRRDSSASSALQNQRVQQIIQATGQSFSPPALTSRFTSIAQNPSQQQQFYASLSAPSSSAAVNQQARPARPPVPLFSQKIGNQRVPAKMDLQGKFSSPACKLNSTNLPISDAMSSLEGFTAFGGGASTAFSSPAIHDLDMSPASSSTNLGTVSPGELLLSEQYSAPNSSAFTNLTTPSNFGESPEYENYEVSPNFGDFDAGSSENWYSLFPESTITDQVTTSTKSSVEAPAELEKLEADSLPCRKSGTPSSPSATRNRHSSVSGVNARRRDKPLPPIIIDDPNDTVAMKRARNTLAARKSRERKAQKLEELEEKIAKLEQERDHWKRIALSRPSGA
ncbi:hypothetical protein F4859DRAFT_503237 [Xylaria cf. heliscus]|nr:hypothetical protein F4859DRAFT_503237 [Xylaria cf. heliscus]